MQQRLLLILVTALPVGADDPRREDAGEVRLQIPPGSRWSMVRGWRGNRKLSERSVLFVDGNRVLVSSTCKTRWGISSGTQLVTYRVDEALNTLVIHRWWGEDRLHPPWAGTFRMAEGSLCLELEQGNLLIAQTLPGDLLMVLEPGK
jgi:hypothetical protein